MQHKRILLFSLFFSILTVSLIAYALPRFLYRPLRRDSIPLGAYIIPWARPNPSIEELNHYPQLPYSPPTFDVDLVMAEALKLNMIFRISTPGGIRTVPSTVYLGHDADHLYVAGKFVGMYDNPSASFPDVMPNIFDIMFDADNDGVLKTPESGSRLAAYVYQERAGFKIYVDKLWYNYPPNGHAGWILASGYCDLVLHRGLPVSYDGMETAYYNSTGTLMVIYSRLLRIQGNIEVNALQMRLGERWTMGFLLEAGYETDIGAWGDYVDGWPQKTYPYLSNNASWWPKLVIDLTNPPQSF